MDRGGILPPPALLHRLTGAASPQRLYTCSAGTPLPGTSYNICFYVCADRDIVSLLHTGHKILATKYLQQNTSHKILATNYWLQNTGHKILATKLLATKYLPQNTGHKILATKYWPQNTSHKILATNYWPQNTGHKILATKLLAT